jgi:hypothetical protein
VSKKQKRWPGHTPLDQPIRYPDRPQGGRQSNISARPGAVGRPRKNSNWYPPTKGPKPPPKNKPGCGFLVVLLVLLAIGILYVKLSK